MINRKWSNQWLTDRKCSTYSIILIECSVSCCQTKYSLNSDKHSVVIKKIEKIIITFYVFVNLQFLINRFQRDGAKNSQQFDSFKGFGRLRLHRACWVKWSLSGSISRGQWVTVVRWFNYERIPKNQKSEMRLCTFKNLRVFQNFSNVHDAVLPVLSVIPRFSVHQKFMNSKWIYSIIIYYMIGWARFLFIWNTVVAQILVTPCKSKILSSYDQKF